MKEREKRTDKREGKGGDGWDVRAKKRGRRGEVLMKGLMMKGKLHNKNLLLQRSCRVLHVQ